MKYTQAVGDMIALQSFSKFQERIWAGTANPMADVPKVEEKVMTATVDLLGQEFSVELSSGKVACFPKLTPADIAELIALGKLDKENLFDTEKKFKNGNFNREVSQAFVHTITDEEELRRVIPNPKSFEAAKQVLTETGAYRICVLNEKWLEAWAEHLGSKIGKIGKIPSGWEELQEIRSRIPGKTNLEKAVNADIQFAGCFYAGGRGFFDVGNWAYWVSSFKNDDGYFQGLDMGRGRGGAGEDWDDPVHGFSAPVVFG